MELVTSECVTSHCCKTQIILDRRGTKDRVSGGGNSLGKSPGNPNKPQRNLIPNFVVKGKLRGAGWL